MHMLFKKLLSLLAALSLILTLSSCGTTPPTSNELDDVPVVSSEPEPEPEPELAFNNLTGEKNLPLDAAGKKPVAVMVNNASVAQKVQSGLDKADVVFETEVEGGITRLIALFSDPTNVSAIGTIRSLRVPFADIACGMDAILFYHGIDGTYCAPHLKTLPMNAFTVDAKTYGYRDRSNGLAYEHTLYTTGEKIDKAITDKKYNYTSSRGSWLTFNSSEEAIVPVGVATNITAKFSTASTTKFLYNAELKKYARANKNNVAYTDLSSGNQELFTNIFILKTTISYYPDGVHRKVDLSSGSGYYATAGGFEEINWKKGSSTDNFSFTKTDGSPLTVNQGNSYVCIMGGTGSSSFE